MSLSRLAMRIAAARALRGVTFAGERVFDSAIDPIDATIAENRSPILVVMTDEHEVTTKGRDLFQGEHACDLVIEAAIASRVETAGEVSITIPHTDEGMELVLDIMEHQVLAALMRERTAWSRAWLKLVPRVRRRLSRRGASSENGVRFAARQIVLTCDLVETPQAGADILSGGAWSDVLSVMGSDDALLSIADLVRSTIEGTVTLDKWVRDANTLGILGDVANSVAIGPMMQFTPSREGPVNGE